MTRDAFKLSRLSCSYRNKSLSGKYKQPSQSLVCLDQLEQEECSKEEYVELLRSCSSPEALASGKRVHEHAVAAGKTGDLLVANMVVQMYGNCGSVVDALQTFETMPKRNVFSWCILFRAFTRSGHLEEAKLWFERMPQHNVVTWNSLLRMYAQDGKCELAEEVFSSMPERSTASWNVLITAYAQSGKLLVFRRMDLEGNKPDTVTFLTLLDRLEELDDIRLAHSCAMDVEFDLEIHVATAFVNAYGKCGNLSFGEKLFDTMPKRCLLTWSTMLTAYAQNGHLLQAEALFEKMPARDIVSWNMILRAHSRFGRLEDAMKRLERIPEPNSTSWTIIAGAFSQAGHVNEAQKMFERVVSHNVVSWTASIASCVKNRREHEAIRLFKLMDLEGIQPNHVTLTCILDACANLLSYSQGKLIYSMIEDPILRENSGIVTSLVNMYGNCGQITHAWTIFKVNFCRRTLILWTSMICVYAKCGFNKSAMDLFREMCLDGEPPDEVTFTSILSACSHSGLAYEAMLFLDYLCEHEMKPTLVHMNCILDLLARAGKLGEAEELMKNMPFEPDFIARTALLSSCRLHEDNNRGSNVASDLLRTEPAESSSYMLLASL